MRWFRTNAAPLAAAYEGAIWLVDDGAFPGRAQFIAHAVRDISDRLVYVLDPQGSPPRVQYENALDEIEAVWPNLASVQMRPPREPEPLEIEPRAAFMIDALVTAHRERKQRPSQYELLFRFLMRKEPAQVAVNERLVKDFKRMRKWFMGLAHFPSKQVAAVDESKLQMQFGKFERMLHSFVGNFFTGMKEIDEILRQANQ